MLVGGIPTSQLVFYLFDIGMTQFIYHLFNKNGGRFKTHVTFSMELFARIVHGFRAVAVVAKGCLVDGAGFMDAFPEKDIVKIKIAT